MEFRLLDETWRPAVMTLWDYCFEKRSEPFYEWYFSHYCRLSQVIGAVEDGQLLAMAHLNPYHIALRGRATPAAYFVGVATAPEVRGQGLFRPLLTQALRALREQGHGVTLLMPSAGGFYRPYGFAYCYHQWQFDCSLPQLGLLGSGKEPVRWRRGTADDWPAIAHVYAKAMKNRHGFVCRTETSWRSLLQALFAEGGHCFVASDEAGEAVAYIWFVQQGQTLQVVELMALGLPAQRACLAFLHQHRSQAEKITFRLPGDDLFYEQLPDDSYPVLLKPFMMGRIVDVVQALQRCLPATYTAGAALTIAVRDEVASWNNGCWRIAYTPNLSVTAAEAGAPDIVVSVDALVQLCFGCFAADQLLDKGVLTGSPEARRLLDQLLPVCRNFIN